MATFRVLDSPDNVVGLYLWANDINWMTEDTAQLDAVPRTYLVNELAPHVKAFESYPGGGDMQKGNFALSHAWNGDARQGILGADTRTSGSGSSQARAPRSGWTPTPSQWGAEPERGLRLDQLPAGARGLAAGAGVHRLQHRREGHRADGGGGRRRALDIVFFTAEQVATMEAGELNEAQERRVEISNKIKAAAGS